MVTKLVVFTISTGMLTSCFAIADLVGYAAAPHDLYLLFFNFLIGKRKFRVIS
ncbi:hypothetical protein EW026_g7712 [Hermanssonia centrifuga]|uniref:Uncharacterized protein n=1 Tax=Hermanssonia centrifuga TaxID=98765 RepID=A0A4S4K6U7_9APHY|nr:hypothetical protein EW026_g7712 [Hermanssonia centrifuga]